MMPPNPTCIADDHNVLNSIDVKTKQNENLKRYVKIIRKITEEKDIVI